MSNVVSGGLIGSLQMTRLLIDTEEFRLRLINITIDNWRDEPGARMPTEPELNAVVDSLIQKIRKTLDNSKDVFKEFMREHCKMISKWVAKIR